MSREDKNIIHLTFDSLRADHCGFIGSEFALTPQIDSLADEGIVFERAIAPAPRTTTSIPETLTGEPMPPLTAETWGDQMDRMKAHVNRYTTISESLADLGYSTMALTANPWISSHSGFDRKFNQFVRLDQGERSLVSRAGLRVFSGTQIGDLIYYADSFLQKRGSFTQWSTSFDSVVQAIDDADNPFFVWVFLMDSHNPYIVPREDRIENSTFDMYYAFLRGNTKFRQATGDSFLKESMSPSVKKRIKRAYRDSVRSLDRFVGEFIEAVDTDNTTLIIHSDHGEAFNEHGTYGHQQALYEENIHVPLLIWDDSRSDGVRIERPYSLRSLPEILQSDLESLENELPNSWPVTKEPVISRTESGDSISIREKRWKYISTADVEELFDLRDDPGETEDVSTEHPSICDRMRTDVQSFKEQLPDPMTTARSSSLMSEEMRSQLETLGYID